MSIFKTNSDAVKKKQVSDEEPKEVQENTYLVAESKVSDSSTEHTGIGKLMNKAKLVMKSTLKNTGELEKQENKVDLIDEGNLNKKIEPECQEVFTSSMTPEEQELQDILTAMYEKYNFDGTAAESKQVSKFIFQPQYYKPIKDTKLTIIFLENTSEVSKDIDNVNKIVNSIKNGFVSIINYGSKVMQTELFEATDIKKCELFVVDDIGDNSCLFNALVELEHVVYSFYYKVLETEAERIRIKNIEVIGIGQCFDNCSTVSKEVGMKVFSKISKNPNIVTKYFTLTEESFIQAATIGFRSIGAIYRNYM